MTRREVCVGLDVQGVAPWDADNPAPGYYGARFTDDTDDPILGMLWLEIRTACRHLQMKPRDAAMLGLCLKGMSYRQVARLYSLDVSTVYQMVQLWKARLLECPNLGLLTVIVEEHGVEALRYVLGQ